MATQYYYGLRRVELMLLIYGSIMLTLLLFPFYWGQTIWVAVGIAFTIFVLGHMCLVVSRCVILPELITFVACLSWVIAPWLAYRFPPSLNLYGMSVPPETYFSYTVPVVLALWFGIHAPLRFNPNSAHAAKWVPIPLTNRDRFLMDALIVVGYGVSIATSYAPASLAFLFYILAQLRFVGAFSLMFTRAKGWQIRIVIVFLTLLASTASAGLFYELILWIGYLLISLAFVYRWRWKLIIFMFAGLLLIVPFNSIKGDYRLNLLEKNTGSYEKVKLLMNLVWKEIDKSEQYSLYRQAPGDHLVRWNQGWIVSKVMFAVPDQEPFGNGETILSSVVASLVPRIWLPGKLGASSRDTFARFTNLTVPETTSMALGVSGEMYANFGLIGGIAGIFIYSVFIGFIFSRFARAARNNLLWWAWAPFVLLPAIEAEWNLVDILNHITKSSVVMLLMIYMIPIFKRTLWKKGFVTPNSSNTAA